MSHFKSLEETAIKPAPDFNQLLNVLWRKGKPDYVPFYELFVNPGVMEAILGRKLPDRVSTVEFYYRSGYDYLPVWPDPLGFKVGSLIDTRPGYPVTNREDFERYSWPEPSSIRFSEFEAVIPILPAGMKMIGQTGGIFEMAEYICGYQNLCCLLADDRGLVHEIFEHIGILYERLYSGMAAIPEVGALVISDDLGFKTQTLISPQDLREFVLPWHKRLAKIIHEHNKPCILHSCGNLSLIMEDIIEDVGIDAKHSYEDAILPVTQAKKIYGDRIALLGGFDVDRLCRNSGKEVRDYVNYLLKEVGGSGGYALGSGNSITDYVPVENYLTMLDQGWKRRE
ncbi:MAG: uroporphyrinogen decarboxylase family protein [Candidatus Omnitrophota bacterium]